MQSYEGAATIYANGEKLADATVSIGGTMKQADLKACPFCGPLLTLPVVGKASGLYRVLCQKCDVKGPSSKKRDDAMKAWNKRCIDDGTVADSIMRIELDDVDGKTDSILRNGTTKRIGAHVKHKLAAAFVRQRHRIKELEMDRVILLKRAKTYSDALEVASDRIDRLKTQLRETRAVDALLTMELEENECV